MNFLDTLSFRRQILLSFLIVALIPLFIAVGFITKAYSFSVKREMESEGKKQIVEIADKFESFLSSAEEVCSELCENDLTANALSDKVKDEYLKELYITLYKESVDIPLDLKVGVYDAGGELRFSSKTDDKMKMLPLYWGILAQTRADRKNLFQVSGNIADAHENTVLQTSYTVQNKFGAVLGYIVMSLDTEDLNTLFSGCYNTTDAVFITDPYMNLIYSSDAAFGQETIDLLAQQKVPKNYSYAWSRNEKTGYMLILQKSSGVSAATNRRMMEISIELALVSMILCVAASMLLGKQLSEPINKLNRAMDLVKNGNLTIHIETKQKNELGELTNNFNRMTEELNEHVKNMVQKQKDIKDMQIQLFQTQLNPHFLYNTLDSIKWTARLHQLDDISLMAENLAYILQYSIRSEQFIPLRKEMEIIENYIQVQQIRFQGKFHYEAEIPEGLADCIVPKLMLQPIVENSIIHGLAEKENGNISIYADQVGEAIHIYVTDDGIGISEEIIEWLQNGNFIEKTGHLGLYNVNKIIKLYFGVEYGLTATVEEGIGTTITIVLPIRKENLHDKSADC